MDGYSDPKKVKALVQLHKTSKKYVSSKNIPDIRSRIDTLSMYFRLLQLDTDELLKLVDMLLPYAEIKGGWDEKGIMREIESFLNGAFPVRVKNCTQLVNQLKKLIK